MGTLENNENTEVMVVIFFYHGIFQRNYRKTTIQWSFSYITFVWNDRFPFILLLSTMVLISLHISTT